MKKLLFLFSFLAIAGGAFAQAAIHMPLAAGDTLVNTGTTSKVLTVTSGPSGVIFQANLTKISGTGAGTLQLQGSVDGVNYTNIGSAYTITNTATQSAQFTVTAPVPTYLKILGTGSGTESVQIQYWYRAPKYQQP